MPGPQESVLVKYNYPLGFALLGFAATAITNYRNRKPLMSGIQKHITWAATGGLFGYFLDKKLDVVNADRDAHIRHYVETHPEDFAVNRRKYKEIFEEWIPVR